ncbi:MAG: polyhydroxyalkanoate depolymerase, partial [Phenylobacterium sp.]
MLYSLYEAGYYGTTPLRLAALMTRDFWSSPLNPAKGTALGRRIYATSELLSNLTRRYGRPDWGVDEVEINGKPVGVSQEVVWSSPWVKLTHFRRDPAGMRAAGRTGPD